TGAEAPPADGVDRPLLRHQRGRPRFDVIQAPAAVPAPEALVQVVLPGICADRHRLLLLAPLVELAQVALAHAPGQGGPLALGTLPGRGGMWWPVPAVAQDEVVRVEAVIPVAGVPHVHAGRDLTMGHDPTHPGRRSPSSSPPAIRAPSDVASRPGPVLAHDDDLGPEPHRVPRTAGDGPRSGSGRLLVPAALALDIGERRQGGILPGEDTCHVRAHAHRDIRPEATITGDPNPSWVRSHIPGDLSLATPGGWRQKYIPKVCINVFLSMLVAFSCTGFFRSPRPGFSGANGRMPVGRMRSVRALAPDFSGLGSVPLQRHHQLVVVI